MQGMAGNGSRFAGALTGLAVFLMAVAMAGAAAQPDKGGTLQSRLDFAIKPSKLSQAEPTPVWTEIAGRYRTDDDSHLPAAKELRLSVDRHLALDLKGVPGCRLPSLRPRPSPGEIEAICRESIVGRGEISFEVEFPDQPKTTVKGRLVLFRATDSPAGIDLVAHAFLAAPVTADIVTTVDIRRVNRGRFGWEARASIPKIAGGHGSLTDYSLRIGKRFLSARCVGRKLELRVATLFADGTVRRDRAVRPCGAVEEKARIARRPVVSSDGDVTMVFNGGIAPAKLPQAKPAPVALTFGAKFSRPESADPPALHQLLIETEAAPGARLAHLPVCPSRRIPAVKEDEKQCAAAVLGSGFANVAGSGDGSSKPIDKGTTLVAYNGGRVNGKRLFWLRLGPAQTGSTAIGRIVLEPVGEAPYRLRLKVLVPKIPALRGGIRSFSLTLNRKYAFAAACPRPWLRMRGTAVLADGSRPSGEVSQRCSRSG
jgi:hypothetical protein